MNGRLYDYNLGRFLSVDPFIAQPGNSQSLNPYSYIMNNPLAGTDPSGYIPLIPLAIWAFTAYGAYETVESGAETLEKYNNGEITKEDAAKAVGAAVIEKMVLRKAEIVLKAVPDSIKDKVVEKLKGAKDKLFKKGDNGNDSSMKNDGDTSDIGNKKNNGRADNHNREDPDANGEPHSVSRTDQDGNVTHYETYNYKDGKKSAGDGKRVDVEGADHAGVPTPHVVETKRHVNPKDPSKSRVKESKTRPARKDEIPKRKQDEP